MDIYILTFIIYRERQADIDLVSLLAADLESAESKALLIINKKHKGSKIEMQTPVLVSRDLVDEAYLSRHQ